MKKFLRLMRVHHYIKNILILLPLVFSGKMLSYDSSIKAIYGFLAFSFASSIVYIINDIQDINNDREHPIKCKRPIASGAVSVRSAWVLSAILFLLTVTLNYLAANTNIISWLYILLYVMLNVFYSMGLKNVPLIDVTILVAGFLIRVLYGSTIIDVVISKWLYLTVISMSFFLSLGKRRNEIVKQGDKSRKVLKLYTHKFLDRNMYMCLTLTMAFYALWCVDSNTIAEHANRYIVWTVPLVMLISMKYSFNIEGNSFGDPVDVLLADKILIGLVSLYGISTLWIIYLNQITYLVSLLFRIV